MVVFTSNGRRSDEADGWIAKDNAVLHELYRSVVTKRESSTVKLSVLKLVLLRSYLWFWILGNDRHNISSTRSREGFFWWVRGVTLRDKVRSYEIRRTLNVEPHLLGIERAQISIYLFQSCAQNSPKKDWRGKSSWLNPWKSGSEVIQGLGVVNIVHLRPCFVSSWCGTRRTIWNYCWSWGISSPPRAAVPATLPRGKAGRKMNGMNNVYLI